MNTGIQARIVSLIMGIERHLRDENGYCSSRSGTALFGRRDVGTRIASPSEACGGEQLASDVVWGHDYVTIASLWLGASYSDAFCGHDYVTIASLWLRATYHRRGLRTRLRYHRKLVAVSNLISTRFGDRIGLRYHHKVVAVSNLPATWFGDTITLSSQACGCKQFVGTRLRYHLKLVTVSNLPLPLQACGWKQPCSDEDRITLPSQACGCEQHTSDKVRGHDHVAIVSSWL